MRERARRVETSSTFRSISGFALPSLIHKRPTSPIGFLFWNFRHRLCGTSGIVLQTRSWTYHIYFFICPSLPDCCASLHLVSLQMKKLAQCSPLYSGAMKVRLNLVVIMNWPYIYMCAYIYIYIPYSPPSLHPPSSPPMGWVPGSSPYSLLFASYWQHFWGPALYLLGLCSISDYQPRIY